MIVAGFESIEPSNGCIVQFHWTKNEHLLVTILGEFESRLYAVSSGPVYVQLRFMVLFDNEIVILYTNITIQGSTLI